MFRTATFLFLSCLMFTVMAQPIQESLVKTEMMKYAKLRQSHSKRSNPSAVDVLFVDLAIQPDMNNGHIKKASIGYVFKAGPAISSLDFDLRKELTVDSVLYHGSPLNFTHSSNHLLVVDFPQPVSAGKVDSLKIFYQGTPNMSTRAYMRYVTASGPSISTLSEPYYAYYWWPCRENLSDKIDSLNVSLTVDTPYTAVSNGTLVSTVENGGLRTFNFRHRYPIVTYLVAVSFARYNFYIQQAYLPSIGQPLDIRNYVFAETNLADAKNKTASTAGIMRLYDSLFGTYPFHKEHYGHAQFGWSGGMEHQTMSFMANFNYDLIAHELAHQWFGDKLTCGSWRDIWLNESFATYSTLLTYDFMRTDAEWIFHLKRNKADVLSAPYGSVYANDTTSIEEIFNYRTTYQKGAMVLHQLRWVLGDTVFFRAVRNYLADTALAYDFARGHHLQRHFEEASGLDLSDYFNDWIYGQGYPLFDITWAQKGKDLQVDIIQTQSHASVPEFNVPIPLLARGTMKDTLLVIPVHDGAFQFSVPLDFRVREVVFDPREWLLAKHSIRFTFPESGNITVFPNPFDGIVYLSLEDMDMHDWEITDASGRRIVSHTYETDIPRGNIEKIDCNFLASGVYLIKINGNDRSIVKKIIRN